MPGELEKKRLNRAEKRAQTRERLLESAAKIFAEHGFERASVDDVAEEAGYSKGAVYSNFESKEELFMELFEKRSNEALERLDQLVEEAGPPEFWSREGAKLFSGIIEGDRKWPLLLMEFWTYAARNPKLRKEVAARSAKTRRTIAGIIEAQEEKFGYSLPLPAEQLAQISMALADGIALQKLIYPDWFTEEYFGHVIHIMMLALVTLAREDQRVEEQRVAPRHARAGGN